MARPVIALLTDFGTRDHYAGAMKGVALGICPDATLVDISHEVPPHDVGGGALGRPAGSIHRLELPHPSASPGELTGEVLRVDRFGNLITNIDRRTFDKLAHDGTLEIRIGAHQVSRVVSTYADAGPGEICALFGSTDHLEIAASGASAARALGID